MTDVAFRPAQAADRARILEIAGQVWEGDDYIPYVIDEWLAPGPAQLIVATLEGQVVALARYELTFPGYAWFEGLRTDPAFQGRGLAKALTGHLVERARAGGAERIGLSTYLDNYASQKVTAAYGFERVTAFVESSLEAEAARDAAAFSPDVEEIAPAEAVPFMLGSEALRLGRGYLPHSWRFYPFGRGPETALRRMERLLGIRDGGRLAALLCIGDPTAHGPAEVSLDFLEGEREAAAVLVRHALHIMGRGKYFEALIPSGADGSSVALPVVRDLGFRFWNDGAPDVFLLEKDLTAA